MALRLRAILASSTLRLALLHVLLLALSMALLLGFVYWSTAGYMARQIDATIHADIRRLAEQYRRHGLSGLTAAIRARLRQDPAGATLYLLARDRGQAVIGNLDRWPDVELQPSGWINFRLRDSTLERSARARVFRLHGELRLLVGRDVRELEALRALMLDALWSGLALTAALALLGGWLISTTVVRRLEAINQVSGEIMDGDLSRRVPIDGSGDDFDQLAGNLNAMLARIEQLMSSVREVSDNIAHDLRTPLTRLRTRLEALVGEPLPASARAAAEQAVTDAEELLATFNALLRIARIESGSRRAAFARLNLAAVARDLAEFYEPLAAERERSLVAQAPACLWINGDRDLLFQAGANLLENAIKYTPPGGQIQISARLDDEVCLEVADSGPGIPAAWRDKVCERFFRLDDSRSSPGSGLGLSLVRAVAQLHGARLELADHRPGLRVILHLGAALGEPVFWPHIRRDSEP